MALRDVDAVPGLPEILADATCSSTFGRSARLRVSAYAVAGHDGFIIP